jgi:glycosyltransferase involved in cell wall biosynthesis
MDKSLVVLQILPALNNGGVERGTIEIANHLASNGQTSLVVSSGGQMCEKLSPKVKHIEMPVGKKSLRSLFLIKKLKQLFIEYKVDIVHARSRLPAWLAYKAIAQIKTNKPKFVTTVHGLYSVKHYSSIMARGDKVITVSKTAHKYTLYNYSRHLKADPQLINRGIDSQEFPYDHQADFMWLHHFYERNHQLVGHKIVLLPGRLTHLKGVKELETWLKSKDNDAKLVLTANPENDLYAARLYHWFKEIGVQNRVIWINLQNSMADLYAIANVVVSVSTRPESFGRTTLESLAIGTPVVAYDHGGVGEILHAIFPQGKVELGNKASLSEKINTVLKQKPQIPNKQPFQLKDMLDKTLNLYQNLAS